jgi:hypothetical protein
MPTATCHHASIGVDASPFTLNAGLGVKVWCRVCGQVGTPEASLRPRQPRSIHPYRSPRAKGPTCADGDHAGWLAEEDAFGADWRAAEDRS